MSSLQKEKSEAHDLFFNEMSELLEQLIDNVKKLKEASSKIASKAFTEEEFEELQQKQQKMIAELVQMDTLVKNHALPEPSHIQKKIQAQLLEFQKLNKEYVDALRTRLSMIQFSDPTKSA